MEGRVLIIEDHDGNRKLLEKQFSDTEIELSFARTGDEGVKLALRLMPQVILLSTSLPDVSGMQVAKRLRDIKRTQHVFMMMIGDEDNRDERLVALDVGANDFITCPFDPEEVALRVGTALRRAQTANQTDPTTGLPAGVLVQDQLRILLREPEGDWALVRFRVSNLEPFREVYGFMAGADLIRGIARVLADAMGQEDAASDVEKDFLGYGGRDDFIVVTKKMQAVKLENVAQEQFDQEVGSYYGFFERERGYIEFEGKEYPLAALRVRCITPADGPFYDIRSLTAALAG